MGESTAPGEVTSGGGGGMGIAVPQSIGSSINCLGTESTEADRRSRKATKTV